MEAIMSNYNLGIAVIIPGGEVQLPMIKALKNKGYETFVLDGAKDAFGFECSAGALVDITNQADCLKIINSLSDVKFLISNCSDIGQNMVAKLSHSLNLRSISVNCSIKTSDKLFMKQAFLEHGIQSSKFTHVVDQQTLSLIEWTFPKVVKPRIGSGSNCVRYLERFSDVEKYEFNFNNHEYLIEDYIPGQEFAIDGFVVSGEVKILSISEKIRSELPYLLDTKLFIRKFRKDSDKAFGLVANKVAMATKMENCAFHIEVITATDGIFVVECASRGPGFHVFNSIIPRVSGIDTIATLINLVEGNCNFVPFQGTESNYAMLAFPEFKIGKVVDVQIEKQFFDDCPIKLLFKSGDFLEKTVSGATRHAYAIAFGDTKSICEEKLKSSLNQIKIMTEV
jgi:phosphoribosylaminoimidazole carboxylase (NCAIR synthetase)